jgi:hypothetical protein
VSHVDEYSPTPAGASVYSFKSALKDVQAAFASARSSFPCIAIARVWATGAGGSKKSDGRVAESSIRARRAGRIDVSCHRFSAAPHGHSMSRQCYA